MIRYRICQNIGNKYMLNIYIGRKGNYSFPAVFCYKADEYPVCLKIGTVLF